MNKQQMPQHEEKPLKETSQVKQDAEKSMPFLVSFGTYFIVAIIIFAIVAFLIR